MDDYLDIVSFAREKSKKNKKIRSSPTGKTHTTPCPTPVEKVCPPEDAEGENGNGLNLFDPGKILGVDSILFEYGIILLEEEDSEFNAFAAKQKVLCYCVNPKLDEIFIFINSGGGDYDAFMSLYGAIHMAQKHFDKKVNAIVNGYAASGAALALQAADCRMITKNSFLMIHQLRYNTGEHTVQEHKVSNKIHDRFQKTLFKVWAQKMGITVKELHKIIDKSGPDVWLEAHAALKHGLVDEVI